MSKFDKINDRKGSNCIKYDLLNQFFGREDLLPLWIADMDFEIPECVSSAITQRLGHPILGYPSISDDYLNSVINWVDKRAGWKIDSSSLNFAPGIVTGLSIALLGVSQVGDKVLIQPPVYPPFFDIVKQNDRELLFNELQLVDGRWEIDFEDFEKKVQQAKVFIMCNPHNPVGRVFTEQELRKMGELCVKYGVTILSDEIHSDLLLYGNKHIHIASLSDDIARNTITFIAPSKTFNIAGLFTSVAIITHEELHQKYRNQLAKLHIDRPGELGAVALKAAYEGGAEWVDELNEYLASNADYVLNFLAENTPKIKCTKPEATFLLWLDMREMFATEHEVKDFIYDKAKLALNYGADYGDCGDRFVRLNIGAPRKIIEQAMQQLKSAYDKL